jgi:hypothetical protein
LYNNVSSLANGLGEVPLNQTTTTLNGILDTLDKQKIENRPLVNLLEGVENKITPQKVPPQGPVPGNIRDYMQWKAAQQQTLPAGNNYGEIRNLSDDLGDMIRSERSVNNGATPTSRQLQILKNGVDSDLKNFTQGPDVPPALDQASRAADNYYRTYRVPFSDRLVAKAKGTDEADTILGMFVKGGDRGALAQKFYDAMGNKGRAAVQSQMVDKIINDSTDNVTQQVVPGRFLDNLARYKNAYGTFFKGADQQELAGLENLMRNAAQVERVPLGNIGTGLELAGGAGHLLGFPTAGMATAGVGVGSQVLKGLRATDWGKKFLYGLAAGKPLTPEMQTVFRYLRYGVPAGRYLGVAAGQLMPSSGQLVPSGRPPAPSGQPAYATGGKVAELERQAYSRESSLNGLRGDKRRATESPSHPRRPL